MMPDLYREKDYPPDVRQAIMNSGRTGIEIANRWMLGWPKTVKELLEAGEYLAAFQEQVEAEKNAVASMGDMSYLTPREMAEFAGLRMGPPSID